MTIYDIQSYITERTSLERIKVVCPMDLAQQAINLLCNAGWRTVRNEPYGQRMLLVLLERETRQAVVMEGNTD